MSYVDLPIIDENINKNRWEVIAVIATIMVFIIVFVLIISKKKVKLEDNNYDS